MLISNRIPTVINTHVLPPAISKALHSNFHSYTLTVACPCDKFTSQNHFLIRKKCNIRTHVYTYYIYWYLLINISLFCHIIHFRCDHHFFRFSFVAVHLCLVDSFMLNNYTTHVFTHVF